MTSERRLILSKRAALHRRKRAAAGLCVDGKCDRPLLNGKSRCAEHHAVYISYQRAYKHVSREFEAGDGIDDMSGERCGKCGLRLPHDGCLMTSRDYAESRRSE